MGNSARALPHPNSVKLSDLFAMPPANQRGPAEEPAYDYLVWRPRLSPSETIRRVNVGGVAANGTIATTQLGLNPVALFQAPDR